MFKKLTNRELEQCFDLFNRYLGTQLQNIEELIERFSKQHYELRTIILMMIIPKERVNKVLRHPSPRATHPGWGV